MTANLLLARAIALGARAFVIDRAGHYELLTRLVDGAQQIELGADGSPYAINPWDVPDPASVRARRSPFLLSLHTLMMGDEGLGKAELAQLGEAIRAVYAAPPRSRTSRRASRCCATSCWRWPSFHQRDGAAELAALVRNLAMRLSEWCGEGTYAYLLDRPTTVPADSPLVVFDTRRCPQDVLRPVMFSIMEYVTSTVERHWHAHRPARRASRARRRSPGARSCSSTRPGTSCAAPRPASTPTTSRCAPATSGSCSSSSSSSSPRPTPSTAWRCCRTPPCSCCSPSTRASSTSSATRSELSDEERELVGRLQDGQGQPRPDALDQRHPRPRPRRAARRPDRVLGLHLRPGPRRPAPRGRPARARRRRLGGDQRARPHHRDPRRAATATA